MQAPRSWSGIMLCACRVAPYLWYTAPVLRTQLKKTLRNFIRSRLATLAPQRVRYAQQYCSSINNGINGWCCHGHPSRPLSRCQASKGALPGTVPCMVYTETRLGRRTKYVPLGARARARRWPAPLATCTYRCSQRN